MGYLHIQNLYKDQDILLFRECYAMEKIHGCVHASSLVLMHDGTEKQVQEITPGDRVVSFDEQSSQFVDSEVGAVVTQEASPKLDWFEIEFENGRKLVCTEDHPFLTNRGWISASDLCEGEEIISCK